MEIKHTSFEYSEIIAESRNHYFREQLDKTVRWVRHCCVCGRIAPPIDFVCRDCEIELGRAMNTSEALRQPDYPFPVYSLFTWTRTNDHLLRPVLYGLKGGHAPGVLQRWLEILSEKRMRVTAAPYRPIFVVPPRSVSAFGQRIHDHGWLINRSLAVQWRSTIYDGLSLQVPSPEKRTRTLGGWLRWVHPREQKFKSRNERFAMRLAARGELKEFHGIRTTVFADDVITTGATALAAYLALEDPHSFEVWTLACRPKLARPARV